MSFDLLAPHYRWMEFILAGDKLQRCRTAFLAELPACRHALLLGEGNGRFLLECRRVFPEARVTCVDASRQMFSRAQTRLRRQGVRSDGIEWISEDALKWRPRRGAFDLVATHFFLDCFRPDQLSNLVAAVASSTVHGATWLVSDFHLPQAGPSRWRARCILWSMYRFFRIATPLPAHRLSPPDPLLSRHGFILRQRRLSEWGLLHSDRWERVVATPGDCEQYSLSPQAGRA